MPDSKYDFALNFRETDSLPLLQVVHQNHDTEFVLVVTQVTIPNDDRNVLKNFDKRKFDEFIWDIKLNLLSMGVDFTVLGPDEFDPDKWEVQTRMFLEGANARVFNEECSKVKRALISIIWSYKRALSTWF